LEIDHLHRRLHREQRKGLPQILTLLLRIREMVATGPGPGLIPMSLFRTMKTVITSEGVKVYHTKVWVMMLLAGLLTRSPNHYLHVELKGENFLGV